MRLFRFFKESSLFNAWTSHEPFKAEKLLSLFLPQAGAVSDVSVYRAATLAEELENSAAWWTTHHPRKTARIFAIIVTPKEIRKAGLSVVRSPQSGSGVNRVDGRHYDLSGTRDSFRRLVDSILRRLHAGREVIRFYAPSQVRLQLETFFMEPEVAFAKGARQRVIEALGQTDLESLRSRFDTRFGEVGLSDGSSSRTIDVARPTHPTGILRVVSFLRELLRPV